MWKMAKSSPLVTLRRLLLESSDPIEGFHREHNNGKITVDGDLKALLNDIEASQRYVHKMSRWAKFKLALDLWLLPKEDVLEVQIVSIFTLHFELRGRDVQSNGALSIISSLLGQDCWI